MNNGTGNLYVICAPSGTGKTTLVNALVESVPDITVSISHTTRPKRPAEIEGINYHFVNSEQFQQMIINLEFLEYAKVFNHLYGTSKKWVEDTLVSGKDVILEIDWQGAQQIRALHPECISIFILPPSLDILSQRLIKRNQDTQDIIQQRLIDVRESTSHIMEFDYVVMNDQFDHALHELKTIIEAGRLLQKRQIRKFAKLLSDLRTLESI